MHGLWENFTCVICGKDAIRISKKSKGKTRSRAVGVRKRGCITCSKKCARIYGYNMNTRRKHETKSKRLGNKKNRKDK